MHKTYLDREGVHHIGSCNELHFSSYGLDDKSSTAAEEYGSSSMGCGRDYLDSVCRTESNPHIPYSKEQRPA